MQVDPQGHLALCVRKSGEPRGGQWDFQRGRPLSRLFLRGRVGSGTRVLPSRCAIKSGEMGSASHRVDCLLGGCFSVPGSAECEV